MFSLRSNCGVHAPLYLPSRAADRFDARAAALVVKLPMHARLLVDDDNFPLVCSDLLH